MKWTLLALLALTVSCAHQGAHKRPMKKKGFFPFGNFYQPQKHQGRTVASSVPGYDAFLQDLEAKKDVFLMPKLNQAWEEKGVREDSYDGPDGYKCKYQVENRYQTVAIFEDNYYTYSTEKETPLPGQDENCGKSSYEEKKVEAETVMYFDQAKASLDRSVKAGFFKGFKKLQPFVWEINVVWKYTDENGKPVTKSEKIKLNLNQSSALSSGINSGLVTKPVAPFTKLQDLDNETKIYVCLSNAPDSSSCGDFKGAREFFFDEAPEDSQK